MRQRGFLTRVPCYRPDYAPADRSDSESESDQEGGLLFEGRPGGRREDFGEPYHTKNMGFTVRLYIE